MRGRNLFATLIGQRRLKIKYAASSMMILISGGALLKVFRLSAAETIYLQVCRSIKSKKSIWQFPVLQQNSAETSLIYVRKQTVN